VGRLEELGLLYYVMELADDVAAGTDIDPDTYEPLTLKSLRTRRPILPAAEVVRLGVELARGLAGLHAVGLIHRDVKPSNIILVNGVPKLADIGLVSSREVSVTSLGTPGYAPPEGSGSLSADLWGLGRILYELVTGLSTKEFPRLPPDFDQREDAGILLELNEVVMRACEPDPQDRYATAQHMLDELLLVQAGRSVQELNRTRARLRTLARVAGIAAAAGRARRHRRSRCEKLLHPARTRRHRSRSACSGRTQRASRALHVEPACCAARLREWRCRRCARGPAPRNSGGRCRRPAGTRVARIVE
jgi:serine/threonine protein kinase